MTDSVAGESATRSVLSTTAAEIVDALQSRFEQASRNRLTSRPVARAAAGLLDGTLDVSSEVLRLTGTSVESTHSPRRSVLLVASKFGVWAAEVSLVAAVLLRAGYSVQVATEDGSAPHFLSSSLNPSFTDGAWRSSVVSPEERDLALRFLQPGTAEYDSLHINVFDLSQLPKPPQVGDYLADSAALSAYRAKLDASLQLALRYDALCIAGGSGAIPGFMFDRGLHSLILAFHRLNKPIMGQCNGGLSILQTRDPVTQRSILAGRCATTHSVLDEYQSGWGWTQSFTAGSEMFWLNGRFDIDAYGAAETWIQPGTAGNPLIDSEGYFRDAIGPEGTFFSPPGSPYSVVVDGHFITCRTTPDGYPGALALIAILDGNPPLRGPLFIDNDRKGRSSTV